VVVYSAVHTNAEMCGPLVSVGSVGTSYTLGTSGTNLGTACSSRLADQLGYLACLASPTTCTALCVPMPGPWSRPAWVQRLKI
jgi:hypothetical protein